MPDDIDLSMPFTGPDDTTPPVLPPLPPRGRGRPMKAFVLTIVGLVVVAAIVYSVCTFIPFDSWGDEVTVGQVTVHYPRKVPPGTAERLAHFLYRKGIGRAVPADAR